MTTSTQPARGAGREDLSPEALARALGIHEPTEEQARIIAHPLAPLLVVAGAGSGKTATMSQRVVHLVATGRARPEQVLGLTFTRKATAELAQRVRTRLDQLAASGLIKADQDAQEPTVATYDSFAGSIVREHGLLVGVDPDSTLITETRAWQIASDVVEMRTSPLPVDTLAKATRRLLFLDGKLCENLLGLEEAASQIEELEDLFTTLGGRRGLAELKKFGTRMGEQRGMLEAVAEYRARKRQLGVLSFGDQLQLACRIVETRPEVAAAVRAQYPAVLLDEFQDTSVAQSRFLSALFAGSGVTAVGDPNQAIYGWRGASAGALDSFHRMFNPAGTAAVAGGADPAEAAPVLPLSTAWRNDLAVLRAANTVSSPLRAHAPEDGDSTAEHIPVEELRPRPEDAGIAEGAVHAAFVQDPLAEAEVIAAFMEERWSPTAELAVLASTHAQLDTIAEALETRGVPYERVGLGGLLTLPEVADIRALLTVAANPERGDALMRLVTGAGIGATDLRALSLLSRRILEAPDGADQAPEEADTPMLAEALETIARRADAARGGAGSLAITGLTREGTLAADRIARMLRRVRAALALPLPDLVALAEQVLGLDIEIEARAGSRMGRRGLDAFRDTAAQFEADLGSPSVADFLEWLVLAEDKERALSAPEVEPEPGSVQLLTIHAAKGLEWDAIAVAGLVEAVFPRYDAKPKDDLTVATASWMSSSEEFPHPLRSDADVLPPFELGLVEPGQAEVSDVKEIVSRYKTALGRHLVAEQRRLAYVAVTRARHEALLTGSHLAKTAKDPKPMSRFLAELVRRDLVTPYGPGLEEQDPEATNPLASRSTTALWPVVPAAPGAGDGSSAARCARVAAAEGVRRRLAEARSEAAGPLPGSGAAAEVPDLLAGLLPKVEGDELASRWVEEARVLLAERAAADSAVPTVRLPEHLAATRLDDLRTAPEDFALDLRRPLPPRPSPSGRLGTIFHEAIAQRLARSSALLSLTEAGAPDSLPEEDRATLERWLDTAESLPLLDGYVLEETETERELTVGATTLRCRIDAVFRRAGADADEPGAWLIVDWKTGRTRVPVDQLSVYVHAWAGALGIPTGAVRAAYAYVAPEGGVVDELTEEALLGLDEIAEALTPQG